MPKLTWGNPGERLFEVGVDRGVLYPLTGAGVAWSGLISVSESASGGESKPFYMNGIKYADRGTPEEFAATIEAYTYPRQFARCDGTEALAEGLFATQQYRQSFGLSYRTKIGNDIDGSDHGYKIHIVYNARVAPSDRGNETMKDNVEAIAFSWAITTTPEFMVGVRPSAHLVVDSTLTAPAVVSEIEDILYGSSDTNPRLPTPAELVDIYLAAAPDAPFVVTTPDGNGMFTISGPDELVNFSDATHFQLNTTFATDNGDGTYTVTSE
jgi:hypothetical protein